MDKAFRDKVSRFFDDYFDAMLKSAPEFQDRLADATTRRIMGIILAKSFDNERQGLGFCAQVSLPEISRKLNCKVKVMTIKRRLIMLARAWLVSVDSESWSSKTNVKATQKIYPNSGFKLAFSPGQAKFTTDLIHRSHEVYFEREDGEQGERFTIPYGCKEDDVNKTKDLPLGISYSERVAQKTKETADKRKENARWLELSNRFIDCAANAWRCGQEKAGNGSAKALWCGDPSKMTAAHKKFRNELVRTFRSLGGGVASLAWLTFVEEAPRTDDDGKVIFDRESPWTQCVFDDKRPDQFTKNLQSLLKSNQFKTSATKIWHTKTKGILVGWFGDLIEVEPEEGVTRDKLGYSLGDKHIRPDNR